MSACPDPISIRRAELKRSIGALDAIGKQLKGVRVYRDGSFELVIDNPKKPPWSDDGDDAVSITEAELKDLI